MSLSVEKVKEKILKEYGPFYDSVVGLSVEDLKKNVLLYTKYLQETLVALKTMPELLEAQEKLRVAKKPFLDKIKESKEKIRQLKSFVDQSICVEDLENQMIIHTMDQEEQKFKMQVNVDVSIAKESLDQIKGPLQDAKAALQLKITFLKILIDESEGVESGYRDE